MCEDNTWFPKFANCYVEQEDPTQFKSKKKVPKNPSINQCGWIQCDICKKWRILPPGVANESLPEKWDCSLNKGDKLIISCSAPEETEEAIQKLQNQYLTFGNTTAKGKATNKSYMKILESYFTLKEKNIDLFTRAEHKTLTPLNVLQQYLPYSQISNGNSIIIYIIEIISNNTNIKWIVPGNEILEKTYFNYKYANSDYIKDVNKKQREQCLYSEILHILDLKPLSYETIKDMLAFNKLCTVKDPYNIDEIFNKLIEDNLIEKVEEGPLDVKYKRTNITANLNSFVNGPLKFSKPWKKVTSK